MDIKKYLNLQMKKDIISRFDKGEIKIGQVLPVMKTIQISSIDNTERLPSTLFEEYIITKEFIKKLREECYE